MQQQTIPADLITLSDAQRLLGVAWTTVVRWTKDGSLPVHRIGGRPFVRKADAIARRKS